ncbi:MAG: hypothetical protein ACKVS7_10895 [Gemmatimonadaceae bacterium]
MMMRSRTRLVVASFAIAVVATGATLSGAVVRESLPTRLDDSTFWHIVSDLSEPGGFFRSDNFISNEGELQYVLGELERDVAPGRAYVGVGPEQNLTYIAALKPGIAFIVDIRRQNLVQHLIFKALMETSSDRAEFLSRLLSRPRPVGLDSTSSVEQLMQAFTVVRADTAMYHRTLDAVSRHLIDLNGFALASDDVESMRYVLGAFQQAGVAITYSFGQMGGNRGFGSWMPTMAEVMVETDEHGVPRGYLASEASYRTLKDMQERNLIIPVVGDFGGPSALRGVAKWLRSHDATVGAFYASNVEQYLFQSPTVASAFYENLGTFPTDSLSTFVRSASNRGWVTMRNPRSRMAQITMRIEPMLQAIKMGRVANYAELVMLRP